MEEPISERYFNLLQTNPNSTAVLVSFLKEILNLEAVEREHYIFVGRLINLYGKQIVFAGILSLSFANIGSSVSEIRGYLSKVCRNLFMEKFQAYNLPEDLTEKARKYLKRIYGGNIRQ